MENKNKSSVGAILGLIVIVIVIVVLAGMQKSAPKKAVGGAEDTNKIVKVSVGQSPYLGNKETAKMAVVEFSDFECPFCQRFEQQSRVQLSDAVTKSGNGIFVFRNFPLSFHQPAANTDALAALCVADQKGNEAYYSMIRAIYQNGGLNGQGIPSDKMLALATGIGVKASDFNQCLSSAKFQSQIDQDTKDGTAIGITGTPSFVIGKLSSDGTVTGQLIVGALPLANFEAAIKQYQ